LFLKVNLRNLVLIIIFSYIIYISIAKYYKLIYQDNWTALICAAKEGHSDICAELLDHGADIEHRDMVHIIYLFIFLIKLFVSVYYLGWMDTTYLVKLLWFY
jgi:hypothetical protein